MDGRTDIHKRKSDIDEFNNPRDKNLRLFLISTKAGGIGTNLVGANRCIIFDACWNPSHDTQSIYRIFRFGQIKSVYVYRFLAQVRKNSTKNHNNHKHLKLNYLNSLKGNNGRENLSKTGNQRISRTTCY